MGKHTQTFLVDQSQIKDEKKNNKNDCQKIQF